MHAGIFQVGVCAHCFIAVGARAFLAFFHKKPGKMQEAMKRMHAAFPSKGRHRGFEFAEIEKMRTWKGPKAGLESFLPASDWIMS